MRFSLVSTVSAVLGVTLLATRLISPAASAPAQATPPEVSAPAEMPGVAEVDAEVARLHSRIDVPIVQPSAGRNPFDFGERPSRSRVGVESTRSLELVPTAMPVQAPLVAAPALVAILADTIDGQVVRTAVFSVNDDVAFMKSGEDVGAFRVDAIGGESVVLIERPLGRTITLTLN